MARPVDLRTHQNALDVAKTENAQLKESLKQYQREMEQYRARADASLQGLAILRKERDKAWEDLKLAYERNGRLTDALDTANRQIEALRQNLGVTPTAPVPQLPTQHPAAHTAPQTTGQNGASQHAAQQTVVQQPVAQQEAPAAQIDQAFAAQFDRAITADELRHMEPGLCVMVSWRGSTPESYVVDSEDGYMSNRADRREWYYLDKVMNDIRNDRVRITREFRQSGRQRSVRMGQERWAADSRHAENKAAKRAKMR